MVVSPYLRLGAGLAVLSLTIVPTLIAVSQERLDASAAAFERMLRVLANDHWRAAGGLGSPGLRWTCEGDPRKHRKAGYSSGITLTLHRS
jgi:hypothetical protein